MAFLKTNTKISDVFIIEPQIYKDNRGGFYESFNSQEFKKLTKFNGSFLQDNHSISKKNVIRGLHYQIEKPQGKLIRVIKGSIFDVSVDLRKSSKTYGKTYSVTLSAKNLKQLWIPPGIAHGFLALTSQVEIIYKTTEYWYPDLERCILWNDPTLNIEWPIKSSIPIINNRDSLGTVWENSEKF